MRISFVSIFNVSLIILLLSFSLSGFAATVTSTSNGGYWNSTSTWINGVKPAVGDIVIIASGATVTLDINTVCSSITVSGTLKLDSYSLTITGDATVDQGELSVGDGSLYVGGRLNVVGNGNANVGIVSVNNGSVIVVGSIYFYKKTVDGQTNGDISNRYLLITGSGSISLGGTLVGENGTSSATLSQTFQSSFIFKQNIPGNNYWNNVNNWVNGVVPNSIQHSVTIPSNLSVNLNDFTPTVHDVSMSPGSKILLGSKILTVVGDFLNNGGYFEGSGILKFAGTDVDQIYKGSTATISNLQIDKLGKSLRLSGPGNLEVSTLLEVKNGSLNSNGNLTLLSTRDSYAQIGPLLGTAQVIGAVNVQSYFKGKNDQGNNDLTNRGNRMISFPVKDDDASKTLYQQLQAKMFVTGPLGPANGFDMGGNAVKYALTLTTYDEAASPAASYIPVPTINVHTGSGDATILFFRGNRTDDVFHKLNAEFAPPEDVIVNYRGSINSGPISKSLYYHANSNDSFNGINAIGNPYPATIDWNKVYETNKDLVEDEIRIIKPGGGVATRKNGVVINQGENAGQYIQPGQGFYVRKRANVTVEVKFKFEEEHKASTRLGSRFLTLPDSKLMSTHLQENPATKIVTSKQKYLRVNIQQNQLIDETLLIFDEIYNSALDNDDAIYFSSNSVSIGSLTSDNKIASINALPAIKDGLELKLFINANSSGRSKISFTDLSGAEGYQVFLRDALQPESLLNLKIQPFYEFNIDKSNPLTYGINRFTLFFKPEPIPAPSPFFAENLGKNVQLRWTSQAEKGVSAFDVEVSLNKTNFKSIGYVKDAATNSAPHKYSFIDKNPSAGPNYYRLKQINENGTVTYTEIRMVDPAETLSSLPSIIVFPNPATDKITVEFSDKPNSEIEASIYNLQGKIVDFKNFLASENLTFMVNQLPKGLYILVLKSKTNQKEISRVKFNVGL